jgi:DNA-binding transcriptional MerR regulator
MSMTHPHEPLWTLDDLGARVMLALTVDYTGQTSGRVRNIPDRRTIRYYTTLGLIDRPAAMRGRTALYGPRHLLQLVAIKRLQAHGLSLAGIQRRLVGLTDAALRQVARVPANFALDTPSLGDNAVSANTVAEEQPERQFWTAVPSAPLAPRDNAARVMVSVPLDTGVTLFVESQRPLDEHDCDELRLTAAPLLKFLHLRRFVVGEPTNSPKGDTP